MATRCWWRAPGPAGKPIPPGCIWRRLRWWPGFAWSRWRAGIFLLALVAGIAITGPLLPLLNRLLEAGILAGSVAGAPWLVHLVTLASAAGVLLGMRWLARPT